jgi:hypothetical protein
MFFFMTALRILTTHGRRNMMLRTLRMFPPLAAFAQCRIQISLTAGHTLCHKKRRIPTGEVEGKTTACRRQPTPTRAASLRARFWAGLNVKAWNFFHAPPTPERYFP